MERKGISIGGTIVFDYIKIVDSYPKPGHLANILSIDYSVGGAVPNTLIDLSKIDESLDLQAIGIIGEDHLGKYVLKILKEHNIDTKMVLQQNKECTSFTDDIITKSTGERTFFHFRGANSLLDIDHFDFENMKSKILHVGYPLLLDKLDNPDDEFGTVLAKVFSIAQKKGIKTSLDLVSENSDRFSTIVPPTLKFTDYCIINEIEASLTTNIPIRDKEDNLMLGNIMLACCKLKELGVKEWVIIHAPEGAFALDARNNYHIQPSFILPSGYIKGSVGAGDAFCAGVLYSVYNNLDIKTALKIGTVAATSCLSSAGTTEGIKDINSMMRLFDELELRVLK